MQPLVSPAVNAVRLPLGKSASKQANFLYTAHRNNKVADSPQTQTSATNDEAGRVFHIGERRTCQSPAPVSDHAQTHVNVLGDCNRGLASDIAWHSSDSYGAAMLKSTLSPFCPPARAIRSSHALQPSACDRLPL